MALVPKSEGHRGGITAFVVEGDAEGVTVERRNAFLGLRGLENSVTRFHEVRVPEGKRHRQGGTGPQDRADHPQHGPPVAARELCRRGEVVPRRRPRMVRGASSGADRSGTTRRSPRKIAFIAGTTYGMESMLDLCCMLADDDRNDIRIEAALVKLYASEMAWQVADELIQIRGGRGYETAESLAARGERAIPAEQILRDLRINRIFEGSTEIMHLLIAREAVDQHLVGGRRHHRSRRRLRRARPRPGCARAASTPVGCRPWPSAAVRSPAGTPRTVRSPSTCGTSSGPPASSPGPPSTG